jgi:hypothetical protein
MENQPPEIAMGNQSIANCKEISHLVAPSFIGRSVADGQGDLMTSCASLHPSGSMQQKIDAAVANTGGVAT